MRKTILALSLLAFAAAPALADNPNQCKDPKTKKFIKCPPKAPALAPAPKGATGLCKDGTYTMSKTHSGACSHHGGVSKWL